MILVTVEQALKDYLTDNMSVVAGSGNKSVELFCGGFTKSTGSVAVNITAELREAHKDVDELEGVAVRIITKHPNRYQSMLLIQNIDTLLDRVVHKNLNEYIEMCLCTRNSGPGEYSDENGRIHYTTTLYDGTFRYRGND